MRIRTRLRLSVITTVTVALVVGLLLVAFDWRVRQLQAQGVRAQTVLEAVFRQRTLTLEYVLRPQERTLIQWHSAHGQVADGLAGIKARSREERELVTEIAEDHVTVELLFRQLNSLAARGGEARTTREGEVIVAGQLLLKTQAMTSGALHLVETRQLRMVETQRFAAGAVILLVSGMVATVALTSFRLNNSILQPLGRLKQGTERIGSGDLEHRIGLPVTDEVGELGAAFDKMAENLRQARDRQAASDQALRDSELRLRLITTHIEDAFWLSTPGVGEVVYVSPGYERLWGRSCQSLYEHPHSFLEGIHPDDRAQVIAALPLQAEGVVHYEYRVLPPGGDMRWIRARTFPATHDETGKVQLVAGIATDITERKRAEDALRHSNEELANAMDALRKAQEQVVQTEKVVALGTMAAGVAHELNNPLMGIMAFVSYARRHPATPKTDELLGQAERELKRMRDLIRSMLSFARPAEGTLSPVSVAQLVTHAVELLGADLKTRKIGLELALPPDLPLVQAKAAQLEQALLNLMLNARDAVERAAERRIRVTAWSEGEQVFVEVGDTGPGVPDAIRYRIFDPFFTTKSPGEGTGLGLSVSRTIIEDLGGELSLESREGEGARFRLRLQRSHDD